MTRVRETRAQLLQEGLLKLLAPLVSFALRRGIKFRTFEDCAKRLYLKLASQELSKLGQAVNTSKLSAMTGLQRRDVNRLLEAPLELASATDVVTRVVGLWQGDPRFKHANGKLRTLGLGGRESEFAELVAEVNTDLNPYTILFELERSATVQVNERGVTLLKSAYEPAEDISAGLELLAADTSDLFQAVEENVFERQREKNLHIKTSYDNIPTANSAQVRNWFLKEGEKFHERARDFLSRLDRDHNKTSTQNNPPGRLKVAVCSFSLTTVEEEKEGE